MMAANAQDLPFSNEIGDINKQIDSLEQEIHERYKQGKNNDLYNDEQSRQIYFAGLAKQKALLRNNITMLEAIIETSKTKLQWIETLRNYYSTTPIDTLFSHSDPTSLKVHKQILEKRYPKVIDELQILMECSDALKNEYNEKRNQSCLHNLQKVQNCRSKEYLEGVLQVQLAITEEVDNWISKEEYSLYDIFKLADKLYKDYEVDLESDFPFLANKIRGIVQENMKKKSQGR